MNSFTIAAAIALMSATLALADDTEFEFYPELNLGGDKITGDIDADDTGIGGDAGCISHGIPILSARADTDFVNILNDDYCIFTWNTDPSCGGCADATYNVKGDHSNDDAPINFSNPAIAAVAAQGVCPTTECPMPPAPE